MNSETKSFDIDSFPVGAPRASQVRVMAFVLACAMPLVLAWSSIRVLTALIWSDETFSQIPIIPLVSAFLVWSERKRFLANACYSWLLGTAFIVPGLLIVGAARLNLLESDPHNQACLLVAGVVLTWIGAFALFFGARAFRDALFPLLFLVFMIPIPEPLLSKTIYLLQAGSAAVAEWFFRLADVPYLRRGFVFFLPKIAIRVAEECSGIRSSLALLITTVLAAYLFLKTAWKRLLLCALVIPLAIFKNGLRIMTLSTLAIYVDPGFLYGKLHHRGGIVFFMIALVPMILLLLFLQKSERPHPAGGS